MGQKLTYFPLMVFSHKHFSFPVFIKGIFEEVSILIILTWVKGQFASIEIALFLLRNGSKSIFLTLKEGCIKMKRFFRVDIGKTIFSVNL